MVRERKRINHKRRGLGKWKTKRRRMKKRKVNRNNWMKIEKTGGKREEETNRGKREKGKNKK